MTDPPQLRRGTKVAILRGVYWATIVAIVYLTIRYVDRPTVTLLQAESDTELSRLASAITDVYSPISLILIAVIVFLKFRPERNGLIVSNKALLVALAGSLAVFLVSVLEVLFARPDPKHASGDLAGDFVFFQAGPTLQSFPSGVATTAMALSAGLAFVVPSQKYEAWAAGILFSVAPVIAARGYPSDAIAGAVLGLFCAGAVRRVLLFLDLRLEAKRKNNDLGQ
jgi:membrane-associated phospholipid phosphatase